MGRARAKGGAAGKVTPMMQQYLAAKASQPDALLLFRLGDFYEMFFDDAVEANRLLDVALTHRGTHAGEPIPMAGVPAVSVDGYIRKLLEAGRTVAICDQVEDARLARGIVKRDVTRVLSPGVRPDGDGLERDRANYLVAVHPGPRRLGEPPGPFGLAAVDVSTGDLRGAEVDDLDALADELRRLDPAEIVVAGRDPDPLITRLRAALPRVVVGGARTDGHAVSLPHEDDLPVPLARAAEALGAQLGAMRVDRTDHLRPLARYHPGAHLVLDATTLRNLEIFTTTEGKAGDGTLFGLLARARTGPGARTVRAWLRRPMRDVGAIEARQDAVAWLLGEVTVRADLADALGGVRDLERLCARTVAGTASPRDLGALRDSLRAIPTLAALIDDASDGLDAQPIAWLRDVAARLDPLDDLRGTLDAALTDQPPAHLRDGGVIADGWHPEIAELRGLAREGADWFVRYEAEQRERCGIPSLKVRYNKVFGYYIEVTRTHLHKVPDDYIRKQTIANGERYFTAALKEREARALQAGDRLKDLEAELFGALRDEVASHAARLQGTAAAVGDLDALAALAEVSSAANWCRPTLHEGPEIELAEGRHPTLEPLLPPGDFIPNDVRIGGDHGLLLLITGPNMAGKSTVMRQLALSVVLAQTGCWVPAAAARVGVADRVFTRVGASDSITTGRSTFMVEMVEAAEILRHATERSVVLLDEIGRGTATYDGMSIARAVAEDLCDRARARTLFATHYHELCDMTETRPDVRNAHVAVREFSGEILFLRRLVDGSMHRSYGVEVARLAGLPQGVVERARALLAAMEARERAAAPAPAQPDLFGGPATKDRALDAARALLAEHAPDDTTPREALALLYELAALLDEAPGG